MRKCTRKHVAPAKKRASKPKQAMGPLNKFLGPYSPAKYAANQKRRDAQLKRVYGGVAKKRVSRKAAAGKKARHVLGVCTFTPFLNTNHSHPLQRSRPLRLKCSCKK